MSGNVAMFNAMDTNHDGVKIEGRIVAGKHSTIIYNMCILDGTRGYTTSQLIGSVCWSGRKTDQTQRFRMQMIYSAHCRNRAGTDSDAAPYIFPTHLSGVAIYNMMLTNMILNDNDDGRC